MERTMCTRWCLLSWSLKTWTEYSEFWVRSYLLHIRNFPDSICELNKDKELDAAAEIKNGKDAAADKVSEKEIH